MLNAEMCCFCLLKTIFCDFFVFMLPTVVNLRRVTRNIRDFFPDRLGPVSVTFLCVFVEDIVNLCQLDNVVRWFYIHMTF